MDCIRQQGKKSDNNIYVRRPEMDGFTNCFHSKLKEEEQIRFGLCLCLFE